MKKKKKSDKKDIKENTTQSLLPDLDITDTPSAETITETTNLLAELGLGDTCTSYSNNLLSMDNNFDSATYDEPTNMFFNVDLTPNSHQEPSKNDQSEDDVFSQFFSQPIASEIAHSNTSLLSGFN